MQIEQVRVVYGQAKACRVLLARRPGHNQLEIWRRGVVPGDGYRTASAEVHFESASGKGAWLRVILREGRKRQIREVSRTIGLPVVKIIRVRIGSLRLGSLKPREWRYLSQNEVAALKGQPGKGGYEARKSEGSSRPPRRSEKSRRRYTPCFTQCRY